MQFKQIWANLGVQDVKRTAAFYSALGFEPNGSLTADLASFVFSESHFVIHFFRKEKLESAMGENTVVIENGSEVMFSIAASSEQEVNEWAENAQTAGGRIIKKAGRQEDGFYYCVFADPDGHKFNALLIEEGT